MKVFKIKKINLVKKIKILTLYLLFIFFIPQGVFALGSEDISVTIQPEFPEANQEVNLTIESSSFDLNRSEISWYKNNKIEMGGLDKKQFIFETGILGTSDVITIKIKTNNGDSLNKDIRITPAEVSLFIEADSFTPPFYKGKALNTFQSSFKIIAIPEFVGSNKKNLNPEDLIYTWKQDYKILGSLSGVGKNTLTFEKEKLPKDMTITLEVQSQDHKISAKKSIFVKNYSPKIVFYKKDPLLGIVFNKALSNKTNLSEQEITVVAQPFFFSKEDINKNLSFKWFVNNKLINNFGSEIVLRQEDNSSGGSANLKLNIQNNNKIMQSARNSLFINFGKEVQNNLFNSAIF